ncbi:putative fasciclin-like arabinogalactan protein 20 [Mangifera indica]|uniref:putative fasciclin-like arabinogalactan protein 20 n=1 Tax=Mangifera indica TaxID=29780 RepID=UPI001CFB3BCE|nr:putative fasciclin-like arabinogalactan protein 20 [Mangifera indica]
MAAKIFISIIFFSLLYFSSALSSDSVSKAIEILSNSGFFSMALTLEFASNNLIPRSEFLTIFTPSDSTFSSSGQPSLSLLKFHFSPQSLISQSLKTLPFNSKIPTFSPSQTLLVTSPPYSDHDFVSINGVKVNASSVIYDDGWLRVFGIEKFFDPNFRAPPRTNLDCAASVLDNDEDDGDGSMTFGEAIDEMKDKRYSVMASFLELQLATTKKPTFLTVFAPQDDKIEGYFSNFSHYTSVFLRHVVPCKMPWSVLIDLDYPVATPTFLEGYEITVTLRQDHGGLLANEILVAEDVYANEWLAVLGIGDVLPAVPEPEPKPEPKPSAQRRRSTVNLDILKVLVALSSLTIWIYGF